MHPSPILAAYYDEHTGTESDPYIIDSDEDLAALNTRVNNGTEATGKYYRKIIFQHN